MEPVETLVARAAASTYIFGSALTVPTVFAALVFRDPRAEALFVGFTGLIFAWILAFRITFDGRLLTYRTLFGGTKSVEFEAIESVRTEVGFAGPMDPPFRMRIKIKSRPDIVINMKPFRLEDLRALLGMFGDKVRGKHRFSLVGRN